MRWRKCYRHWELGEDVPFVQHRVTDMSDTPSFIFKCLGRTCLVIIVIRNMLYEYGVITQVEVRVSCHRSLRPSVVSEFEQ